MIKFVAALSGLFLLAAAPAQAAAAKTANYGAFAPIGQWVDAMNAGDRKTAAATHVPNPVIIDEFGPHCWTAFDAWDRDLDKFMKQGDVTDFHVAVSTPSFKSADAQQAYAVVPAILSYKVKGKQTLEKGLFTFSLANTPEGWRISGWAWSRQ